MSTVPSLRLAFTLASAVFATGGIARAQLETTFESARTLVLPKPALETVAADLDADGDVDLAIAYLIGFQGRIGILRNRGDGRFDPMQVYIGPLFPSRLTCADFDGDGDVDLFVISENDEAAVVFANHGNGTFAPSVGYPAGYHPHASAVADFDGDARPDVAVLTRLGYAGPSEFRILWNDGAGGLGVSSVIAAPVGSNVHAADFDDDGYTDLALYAGPELRVLRNRGDRTFEPAAVVDLGLSMQQFELTDLDHDGDVDVLAVQRTDVAGNPTFAYRIENRGGLVFSTAELVAVLGQLAPVILVDFDGDGSRDLVSQDRIASELRFQRGRGDGTFEMPRSSRLDARVETLTAADLDGDGDSDLAAAADSILVLVDNHGGARFDDEERCAPGPDGKVITADLDSDGDVDLLRFGYSRFTVRLNRGNGLYDAAPDVPESSERHDVRAADVDGDGDVDLVGLYEYERTLTVWSNQGNGTFTAPTQIELVGFGLGFDCGDADGDGDADLVVAIEDPWATGLGLYVLVLLNQGNGQFVRADRPAIRERYSSLALVDFDTDGDLDLTLGEQYGPFVMAANDGSGRFDCRHLRPLPGSWESPLFVDLDRDGDVDVVSGAWGVGLSLWRNRGDGSFLPGVALQAEYGPGELVALDVDGDGDVDLSTGYRTLENVGGESFVAGDLLQAWNYFRPAAADVDGDGDEDVVLATDLRVMRNVANAGTAIALGDGSGAPCPCGNSGASGRGCANSVDSNGALLRASGNARIANDTLVLRASGMTHGPALWLQGTTSANGGLGAPFGDGLLGVAGTIVRLATTGSSTGSASFPTGHAQPVHALGGVGAPGARTYQVLYRDVASHCTPAAFNLTNALIVSWIP